LGEADQVGIAPYYARNGTVAENQ